MNLRSRTTAWLAVVLAGLALFGGSAAIVVAELRPQHQQTSHRSRPAPVPSVRAAPDQYNPAPPRAEAPAPQRIVIPSIGVDAAVEKVGVDNTLQMGAPENPDEVGWYSLGSSPGQPGDAVIDGHLDTRTGAPAVFAQLSSLKAGDSVKVRLPEGRELVFRVAQVASIPYQATPSGLYSIDGSPRLTLITCTGSWDSNRHTYSERLVVQAVPVSS
ncbi:class F sortase [Candidatus Nephthysia bennettiae]|uniref:Class F sortase n=1 Tax=Candidatus Nephthysia bennettiae TaxID=3127016 RepID=A0A934N9H5_9BACT|nr:class F sortase [Candidatus Dormibacteraeota bacterium]